MNPFEGRITFTYEGGPLNGRTVHHALLPKDPSKPALCRVVTKAGQGETLSEIGGDVEARGLYHLEERKQPLPPEPPEDASEEVKKEMNEAREKATAIPSKWIAVHDPSEQDREFGPLEAPEVPKKEEKEKPKREKRTITIPDDHPMAQRMKPYLKAIRAALDRKKDERKD